MSTSRDVRTRDPRHRHPSAMILTWGAPPASTRRRVTMTAPPPVGVSCETPFPTGLMRLLARAARTTSRISSTTRGGFSDRHLASWRAVDVVAILFELFLAKVVVEDDAISNMIDEVKDLFSFLADNWPPGSCKRPTPTRIASISNGSRGASEFAWSDGAATAPGNASSSPRSALKPEPARRPAPTSSSSVPVSVRSE